MSRLALSGTLLGGVDEEDFFANVWRRSFAHFPGAAAGLAEVLPTSADVTQILAGPAWANSAVVPYLSFPREGDETHHSWITPAPGAHESYRSADESINLGEADRWFPALRPLVASLAALFHGQINAQLFVSEAGGGVRPHADLHEGFVIQIAGRKQWRVVNPNPEKPVPAAGPFTLGENADTYELEPGDVLYVPSHATHATHVAEGQSLSLTMSVVLPTAADAVLTLIQRRVLTDPRWSLGLPLSPRDCERLADAVTELADQIREGKTLLGLPSRSILGARRFR
jgi:ribosomal protein L16 Arg81 hydroxylase